MSITLLDFKGQPLAQPQLDVSDLPGAVILGDRVFFRWQENIYQETAVVRLPEGN